MHNRRRLPSCATRGTGERPPRVALGRCKPPARRSPAGHDLARRDDGCRTVINPGDRMIRRLTLAILATLTAATAAAQTLDVPVQSNVIAINPFGFLFEWYSLEYERVFS